MLTYTYTDTFTYTVHTCAQTHIQRNTHTFIPLLFLQQESGCFISQNPISCKYCGADLILEQNGKNRFAIHEHIK